MKIQDLQQNESSKYRVEIATDRLQDDIFLSKWHQLISNSESQDTIYQTPEFFRFLMETTDQKNQLKIFSIIKNDDEKIISIMPIRIRSETISFQAGTKKLAKKRFLVIGILGSTPLGLTEIDLTEKIFNYFLSQFQDCQAICMAALPSASTLWKNIKESAIISKKFHVYTVDGWRQCHTIPVPSSFELYLKQFSTKKRYNLNRQIRLLEEHCGKLFLHRIQKPTEVPRLTSAIKLLAKAEGESIFLNEEKCLALAKYNLLLCYVLDCGDTPAALIFGTYSSRVFHIHNILYLNKFSKLSIGTSILHLAIEDLSNFFNFSSIDLGYGIPGHDYRSSNITKERGYILIFRKNLKNRLLCCLHKFHNSSVMMTRNTIKNLIKKFNK